MSIWLGFVRTLAKRVLGSPGDERRDHERQADICVARLAKVAARAERNKLFANGMRVSEKHTRGDEVREYAVDTRPSTTSPTSVYKAVFSDQRITEVKSGGNLFQDNRMDQYNNSGKAGVIGPGATVHGHGFVDNSTSVVAEVGALSSDEIQKIRAMSEHLLLPSDVQSPALGVQLTRGEALVAAGHLSEVADAYTSADVKRQTASVKTWQAWFSERGDEAAKGIEHAARIVTITAAIAKLLGFG